MKSQAPGHAGTDRAGHGHVLADPCAPCHRGEVRGRMAAVWVTVVAMTLALVPVVDVGSAGASPPPPAEPPGASSTTTTTTSSTTSTSRTTTSTTSTTSTSTPPTTQPPITQPPTTLRPPASTVPPPTVPPVASTVPTTTASTTILPGDTVPNPTTTLPAPPKPGTAPAGDVVGGGDAGAGDMEVDNPLPAPRLPAPPVRAPEPVGGSSGRIVVSELRVARADLALVQKDWNETLRRFEDLNRRAQRIDDAVLELTSAKRRAVRNYAMSRQQLAGNASDAYMQSIAGSGATVELLTSGDPDEAGRKQVYGGALLDAGERAARRLRAARMRMGTDLVALADEKVDVTRALETALLDLAQTKRRIDAAEVVIRVFDAGSNFFVRGYVFPVADPHTFIDSFGAPRMFGTTFAHFHEGTDIMAPYATPLFSCETGTAVRVRQNTLGGITLTILGESGTEYYYAHLSAYADGIVEGTPVTAGQVVGFVGNTGNARYTPPHLHYEIHPAGGGAVNPYPLLKVVDELDAAEPTAEAAVVSPG